MKKFICLSTAILIATGVSLLLSGCVLPGTGTIHVYNKLDSDQITALYIYSVGSADKGPNEISSPLLVDQLHVELGVDPGDYTIEADIGSGSGTAVDSVTVVEGTIHIVTIHESDRI